jgi:hypothetical protein
MTLNGTETKSQDYNRQRTVFLTELLTNGGYLKFRMLDESKDDQIFPREHTRISIQT